MPIADLWIGVEGTEIFCQFIGTRTQKFLDDRNHYVRFRYRDQLVFRTTKFVGVFRFVLFEYTRLPRVEAVQNFFYSQLPTCC